MKLHRASHLLFAISVSAVTAGVAAEQFGISSREMPRISVVEPMRPFVMRAAQDIAGDMEKIFGARPEIVTGAAPEQNAIVLAKAGTGWENYAVESMPGNVLKITGSDDRGVMFGLYRFASDCLGVDPFYYWNGCEPKRAASREWKSISIRQGDPSFKFRAWFINDEDSLNGYHPETAGKRTIDYERYQVVFGPEVEEHICETAVRAGFNAIIAASYVDILNPDERKLVDVAVSRGLFQTFHHQEPCGVSGWIAKREWKLRGMQPVTYAEDPEFFHGLWRRYAEAWAKVPGVIWQIGLRGVGDRPYWVKADWHSADGWKSAEVPEEVERERAALISKAMNKQVEIITDALGHRPEHFATQLWLEGAQFFRKGYLKVPEGTCIIYADNSPGLKFGPDAGRQKRFATPAGLYYHLAVVHGNHYTQLVPPRRTHEIFSYMHEKGAKEIVIVNVSNVRPFGFTVTAAGEMMRDLGSFSAADYARRWASLRVGEGRAKGLADAIDAYFGAYELVDSRDDVSSYGAKTPRAKLALFNDGVLYARTDDILCEMEGGATDYVRIPSDIPTDDPDALTDAAKDAWHATTQDMSPYLKSRARSSERAYRQSAAFATVAARLRPYGTEFLHQARFLSIASRLYAAAAAGDWQGALWAARERDALDAEMCLGEEWRRWYDRHLIYPFRTLAARIEKIAELERGKQGKECEK